MPQPDRRTLEAVQQTGPTMGSSSEQLNEELSLYYRRGHIGGRVNFLTVSCRLLTIALPPILKPKCRHDTPGPNI